MGCLAGGRQRGKYGLALVFQCGVRSLGEPPPRAAAAGVEGLGGVVDAGLEGFAAGGRGCRGTSVEEKLTRSACSNRPLLVRLIPKSLHSRSAGGP